MKELNLWWNRQCMIKYFVDTINRYEISNEIKIVVPKSAKTYPSICTPLAAIIDEYKDKGYRFNFNYKGINNYIKHTRVSNPLSVEEMLDSSELAFPLDKVWKYNSAEGIVCSKRLLNQAVGKSLRTLWQR